MIGEPRPAIDLEEARAALDVLDGAILTLRSLAHAAKDSDRAHRAWTAEGGLDFVRKLIEEQWWIER